MGLMELLPAIGGAAGGYTIARNLQDTGAAAQQQMGELAAQLRDDVTFRGYGVTTGLGTSAVNPDGSTSLGVGPDQFLAAYGNNMLSAGQGALGQAQQFALQGGNNSEFLNAINGMAGAQNLAQSNASNAQLSNALANINAGSSNPFLADAASGMANTANAQAGVALGMLQGAATNANAGEALDFMRRGATNQFTDPASQFMQQGATNQNAGLANQTMQGSLQGLGGQQGSMLSASQAAMQNAMQNPYDREQQIYDRAMAMQNPELDRAQAAQQAREFAMGRSGIGGSQFGGTQEDAAMARARAEASNAAAFNAMGQAQQELMNQGALSSQFGQLGQNAAQLQSSTGAQLGQLGVANAGLAAQAGQNFGNLGINNVDTLADALLILAGQTFVTGTRCRTGQRSTRITPIAQITQLRR